MHGLYAVCVCGFIHSVYIYFPCFVHRLYTVSIQSKTHVYTACVQLIHGLCTHYPQSSITIMPVVRLPTLLPVRPSLIYSLGNAFSLYAAHMQLVYWLGYISHIHIFAYKLYIVSLQSKIISYAHKWVVHRLQMVCCLAYVVVDPWLQSQILLLHLSNSMQVTSYNHDCKQVNDFGQFINLVVSRHGQGYSYGFPCPTRFLCCEFTA